MTRDWRSGYVEAFGVRFHYYRGGVGKRPLVLAHGLSDNGMCWAPVALRWWDRYDIVLPDARGHGLSDRLILGHEMDPAADLAAFLEAMNLGPVALGGHSMGASSAAVVASRHPSLVSHLILEDPGWRDPSLPADTSRRDGLARFRGKTLAELISMRGREHPTWSEGEVIASAQALIELDMNLVTTARLAPAWDTVLADVRCPGLVLTADPQLGAIVTPHVAALAASLWPQGQFVHISGAGHSIRREQVEPFVAAVEAFLDQFYPPD